MAAATGVKGPRLLLVLTGIVIVIGMAACDHPADKAASAKPELVPTTPSIGAPPANPAPVMPPKAQTVLEPSASGTSASNSATGTPADSDAKPNPAQTAQGNDPTGKQSMTKTEESTAMPKPGQANDHSTTATDGKQ